MLPIGLAVLGALLLAAAVLRLELEHVQRAPVGCDATSTSSGCSATFHLISSRRAAGENRKLIVARPAECKSPGPPPGPGLLPTWADGTCYGAVVSIWSEEEVTPALGTVQSLVVSKVPSLIQLGPCFRSLATKEQVAAALRSAFGAEVAMVDGMCARADPKRAKLEGALRVNAGWLALLPNGALALPGAAAVLPLLRSLSAGASAAYTDPLWPFSATPGVAPDQVWFLRPVGTTLADVSGPGRMQLPASAPGQVLASQVVGQQARGGNATAPTLLRLLTALLDSAEPVIDPAMTGSGDAPVAFVAYDTAAKPWDFGARQDVGWRQQVVDPLFYLWSLCYRQALQRLAAAAPPLPTLLPELKNLTLVDWGEVGAVCAATARERAVSDLHPRSDRFTVLLLGYGRPEGLIATARAYAACPSAQEVVVVWNNADKARRLGLPRPPAARSLQ